MRIYKVDLRQYSGRREYLSPHFNEKWNVENKQKYS